MLALYATNRVVDQIQTCHHFSNLSNNVLPGIFDSSTPIHFLFKYYNMKVLSNLTVRYDVYVTILNLSSHLECLHFVFSRCGCHLTKDIESPGQCLAFWVLMAVQSVFNTALFKSWPFCPFIVSKKSKATSKIDWSDGKVFGAKRMNIGKNMFLLNQLCKVQATSPILETRPCMVMWKIT